MGQPLLSDSIADFNAVSAREGWLAICHTDLVFTRPELAAAAEAWRALAGPRPMPARLEMTPRVLKACLPQVVFIERVSGETGGRRYRVRLVGSAYRDIFGELTGRFLDEALPPEVAPRWHAVLDLVLDNTVPVRVSGRSGVPGKDFFVSEYFAAPLTGPDGRPNHVMGVGYYWAEIAGAPSARADGAPAIAKSA